MHAFTRIAIGVLLFSLLLTLTASVRADVVTLDNGGTLSGKVAGTAPKSAKTVTVTTSSGAVVLLERANVREIRRESKYGANGSKDKLTDAQNAWMPKIRRLVNQASGDDKEYRGRAIRDLRSIRDADAIPALTRYLRVSDLDEVRLLYVHILAAIPGGKSSVRLVEEALFDTSSTVRQAAQDGTFKQRPEYVRPYYGRALSMPNRDVVGRAASALTTVGNRENVPALIDTLYSPTLVPVVHHCCSVRRIAYLDNPISRGGYGTPDTIIGNRYPAIGDHHVSYETRLVENPQVREALEAITKKSFGYNTDAWRRWWAAEQQVAEARSPANAGER